MQRTGRLLDLALPVDVPRIRRGWRHPQLSGCPVNRPDSVRRAGHHTGRFGHFGLARFLPRQLFADAAGHGGSMGSKPRHEDYANRLVVEKERAIYWVCALLERDGEATRQGARRALAELGYDQRRVEAMLLLGEPGQHRASEPAGTAVRSSTPRWICRRRTSRRGAAISETSAAPAAECRRSRRRPHRSCREDRRA